MKKETKRKIIGYIILTIIGTVLPYLTLIPEANQFSALGIFGIAINLFIIGFKFIDDFILTEFDTIDELKNNNIAVGIFMLSYALIFATVGIISFKAF